MTLDIAPSTCVDWVKEAFLMKPDCILPPKISIHPQGSDFINTMPCLLPDQFHRFGCKVVSRIKESKPALKSDLMLLDSSTGNLVAMINCDWITAMRTGAVTTLAINTLRSSKSRIYAFIGLGVIGHAVLDCFFATNSDKEYTIRFKKYKTHAEDAIIRYSSHKNVRFEISDTIEELVDGADVVVSSITDAEGMLVGDTNLFKPGVLVVPVHTRGFQNCDTAFDKVFADDEGHVKGFKYFSQFRKFGEIGEVLSGKIPGRESDTERILSYNIGLGLHDVYFANNVVELLNNQSRHYMSNI